MIFSQDSLRKRKAKNLISNETILVEVTSEELDYGKSYKFVESETCGALNVFIGTVRNHAEGRSVNAIEYEGYVEMAEKQLAIIINETLKKFPIHRVAVQHRLGLLQLKEASVMIMVSSAHRAEAFGACRFIIEGIKLRLPIWKKEHFTDGPSEWKHMADLDIKTPQ